MSAAGSLLMDLSLFGPDEGFLVDVWVNFDVRVVAEFDSVLALV